MTGTHLGPTTAAERHSPPQPALEADSSRASAGILSRLSPQERDCLGADIRTDEQLLAASAAFPEMPHGPAMECLSDENQFQVYLMSAADDAQISEAAHRCIWNALAGMQDIAEPDDDPAHAIDLMGKLFMMLLVMPAYCIATVEPDHAVGEDPATVLEMQKIVCAVDRMGGPEEWTRLLMADEEDFDQAMAQAEEYCATTQPAP